MRFTPQFVAFISICTIIAIALPPPADAAYIASHPSGNRFATAHEADKSRAIFSLPRLPAGHATPNKSSKGKGKSINDTPSSRSFRFSDSVPLNPLAGILDLNFDHVHSDDIHPSFPPRRPTPLSRRSSALVHGAGGNDYLVSRGAASTRPSKRRLGRRGIPGSVFGIIDIVSGEQGQHLASLALDSSTYNSTNTTSTNSTSSRASNGSFPLNASSNNGTQFYLVDANDSSFSDLANATKHVMVQTDIFNSQYCATFDPNPSGPEPMMMEVCRPSQSENEVKNLDYSYANGVAPIVDYTILAADPHKSQIFEYNPSTGVIKPMWTNSDGSTSSRAMFVERDTTSSSATGFNTMTSAGSSTASSTSAPQPTTSPSVPEAQNVTLVFRPSNLAVSAPSPSTSAAASSADDVVTTTITTTVVHTATVTPSSTPSSAAGSPMAAVAGLAVSTSSMPAACSSTSTSTSTPSPALHAAAAASGAGSSSSQAPSTGSATTQATSSSMPPSPSVHAAIAASSPGSSSSQATSTDSATSTQATSSLMPPSPSIHAAIVASSSGLSSSQATSTVSVATIQATSSSMLPSPSVKAAVVASIPGSSSQAISVSSATTSQATTTSQPVRGSLEIEFVPIADSPSSAPITSSSSLPSSSPSSSPSPASATLSQINAAAIASEIANLHSSTSTASSTNTSSSVNMTVAPTTTAK